MASIGGKLSDAAEAVFMASSDLNALLEKQEASEEQNSKSGENAPINKEEEEVIRNAQALLKDAIDCLDDLLDGGSSSQ